MIFNCVSGDSRSYSSCTRMACYEIKSFGGYIFLNLMSYLECAPSIKIDDNPLILHEFEEFEKKRVVSSCKYGVLVYKEDVSKRLFLNNNLLVEFSLEETFIGSGECFFTEDIYIVTREKNYYNVYFGGFKSWSESNDEMRSFEGKYELIYFYPNMRMDFECDEEVLKTTMDMSGNFYFLTKRGLYFIERDMSNFNRRVNPLKYIFKEKVLLWEFTDFNFDANDFYFDLGLFELKLIRVNNIEGVVIKNKSKCIFVTSPFIGNGYKFYDVKPREVFDIFNGIEPKMCSSCHTGNQIFLYDVSEVVFSNSYNREVVFDKSGIYLWKGGMGQGIYLNGVNIFISGDLDFDFSLSKNSSLWPSICVYRSGEVLSFERDDLGIYNINRKVLLSRGFIDGNKQIKLLSHPYGVVVMCGDRLYFCM